MANPTTAADVDLEIYRKELTGYCYRMLGSGFEAEDAVQETMVRAWQNIDRFEGRSALRSWLYRIATNVCVDMLRGPQRRARPMDLQGPGTAETTLGPMVGEHRWVQPIADAKVMPDDGDPAAMAEMRDSMRLAFIAALQQLPPKQRAVLILREVLHWQATEVAELLDTTVASVNSALQRARAALTETSLDDAPVRPVSDEDEALVRRYMEAFERYDIDSLVALIHEDANFTMPPFELWLKGVPDIAKWYVGQGIGCKGSRLIPLNVNGCPGFAAYKPADDEWLEPFSIQVIELSDGRISGLHHFLYPELFPAFGLPERLPR